MNLTRQLAALRYGLILRKPRFLARMARFYAQSFALPGVQPLRYVDFAVDYHCNLHCEHCFKTALEVKKDRPQLTAGDYARVAQECKDMGAIHLSLQGGEVTMLRNLREIIQAMKPRDVLFSLTTNGTLITPTYADCLHDWGVDQLNVSVDSMDEATHDKFRGRKGAWEQTMDGIVNAEAAGLNVQINTTVSRQSLYTRGFADLVTGCVNHRRMLNLVLAAPSGEWQGDSEHLLTHEDMRIVRALVHSSPFVRQDMDSIQLDRGCPAMKEALYITPTGDVLCCPFIHVSFGNVHDRPLADIVRDALAYPFLAKHAGQCLVAEDKTFIARYMTRTYGRADLPAPSQEIFGDPAAAYVPEAGIEINQSEIASILEKWRGQLR